MMTNFESIHDRLFRIINLLNHIEKHPIDLGTGDILTIAEIHTLVAVMRTPGVNVTTLAERSGVTKGAVSQMIKKLEAKGYIRKMRPVGDDREICLFLSDKGNKAAHDHVEFHKRLFADLNARMSSFGAEEEKVIDRFLSVMENHLNEHDLKR